MDQEAALTGQDQRVKDTQYGIDRIRITGLADPATAALRVPLRVEVAALHDPASGLEAHAHVVVRVAGWRLGQFDIELKNGLFRVLGNELSVAFLEELGKLRAAGADQDRHPADLDDQLAS